VNDFDDWDDCTKQHIFDKDAENSDNPAFLWGSDQLVEARAENERLTAQVKALCKYNGELESFVGDMEEAGNRATRILDEGQEAMKEVTSDD